MPNNALSPSPESWSLQGRTALVCGASRGIGEACALLLAERGAQVFLLARDPERLKKVYASLSTAQNQQHRFIPADLSDLDALQKTALALPPVHVLINNSGGPSPGPVFAAQPEEFLAGLRCHVLAAQILAQALVPGMRTEGYGRIVNIISTSVKAPIPGLGVSNTVRGAMASWAKTLASELGPDGITVNNVLPGFTETERLESIVQGRAAKQGLSNDEVASQMRNSVPLRRFAAAREIAEAVAFLAAPAGAYITGINLPVDGGRIPSL